MLARAAATANILARRSRTVSSTSISSLAPAMATVVTVPGMRHLSTATSKKTTTTAAVTGGKQLASMTKQNPHVDVVKYAHKNRTWTLNHVDYFSKALAIGLTENGLQPGDVVLSWLPDHFSEQMVLQFACSKAGMVLYTLDPALATTDPAAAEQALAAALTLTKANVLVSQEAGSDVNFIRLAAKVIPETRIFDFANGMPFVTPRFPHLRLPIHTGFDQDDKAGWLPLRHMVVPSDNLDTFVSDSSITADIPLCGTFKLDGSGIPVSLGKTMTHQQVVAGKVWPTYCSILEKKFHEVAGVGVVF